MFLLNYDRSGQKDFFARLGLKNINQTLLISVSLLVLLCFFLWVRMKNRGGCLPEKASQVAYLNLRQKLSRKGIEKDSFEGPNDFLLRVQKDCPSEKEAIESFRQAYLNNYYGEIEEKRNFKKMVQQIKI